MQFLNAAARQLAKTDAIAFDLEADSMYHFQEKVCLIQIATDTVTLVIDPLKLDDLSPLKPVMANPRIRKVLHGADYDIRSLYRDFNIAVRNLFDTELASRFLGIRESGLDAVLQARFGVHLDKKYQRKDWSKRPLPQAMMDYAAGDVHHLLPLAALLENELLAKGRLSWVREECDVLRQVRSPEQNNAPLFLHFKGAGRLRRRADRDLRHDLHAAGDDHVHRLRHHRLGGEVHRLLGGAALAVDGGGGHGLGPAGGEHGGGGERTTSHHVPTNVARGSVVQTTGRGRASSRGPLRARAPRCRR